MCPCPLWSAPIQGMIAAAMQMQEMPRIRRTHGLEAQMHLVSCARTPNYGINQDTVIKASMRALSRSEKQCQQREGACRILRKVNG